MNYTVILWIVGVVFAAGGFYVWVKVKIDDQNRYLISFEDNHLKHLEESVKNLRADIAKLFDEIKEISDRVSRIEGKLNGYIK